MLSGCYPLMRCWVSSLILRPMSLISLLEESFSEKRTEICSQLFQSRFVIYLFSLSYLTQMMLYHEFFYSFTLSHTIWMDKWLCMIRISKYSDGLNKQSINKTKSPWRYMIKGRGEKSIRPIGLH